ncbi:MAG: type II toxin-antitoxin system MqsR family toxin [Betaproteobacteria bacterium]|nr:type II toxin-antitoxin system MqsR family toxin [Betaproteobacteria bacterium]MCL2886070.1 type II toxin-antitoxin system MqsR family toxin [Betaproteobacteria bacterium]
MEKSIAHYSLDAIKAEVTKRGATCFTHAAKKGIALLDMDEDEALSVVLGLERRMLFKSMTTHTDHRIWQDVYCAPCPNGRMVYIKLTLRGDGAVVIQFKER